ncbi:MAG: Rieske 2Fe-2S domain-containing protein, partial [Actinomycetota bacterium]|nr:Rieske 2Fe-2S domain-containing protein [Actinomycetota bacterium]
MNPVDSRDVDDYERLIRSDRVSGRLCTDPAIFERELERIFHRGWVFVGHESEVAAPGEFVTRLMGRQPVVLTRDETGTVRLWSNRCPHRGATVCSLDRGQTRYFRCPYHAWTFDTARTLVALPGEEGFGLTFDRAEHGLAPVPRSDSYRGFVFGSWSHEGPTLAEHLGQSSDVIDRLCELSPVGELTLRAGWLRHRIRSNWKMAAENVCDFYHPPITHASSGLAESLPAGYFSDAFGGVARDLGGGHGEIDYRPVYNGKSPKPLDSFKGARRQHVELLAARLGAEEAATRAQVGPPHGYIFPNLFIAEESIFVIQPVSETEMTHMQTAVLWAGLPQEMHSRQLRRFEGGFGPGGVVEPDDATTWERIQTG